MTRLAFAAGTLTGALAAWLLLTTWLRSGPSDPMAHPWGDC